MKILLVEDDEETADYVSDGLKREGHVIDRAANGRDGLFLAAAHPYDVMVVDRLLPGVDGLALVKIIRAADVRTPVLFLTAVDGVSDRVEGLEGGADDYLVKPFAFAELAARVNALARSPVLTQSGNFSRHGDMKIDH